MKKKKTTRKKSRPVCKPPVLWTTASGASIRPADMRDEHLTNTVAMLRRRHAHDLNLLRLLECCTQTQDLAKAINTLISSYEEVASLHPAYTALERELDGRVETNLDLGNDFGPF